MSDKKVLIRMPVEMDYFFPAVAFVHNYVMQLRTQLMMGLTTKEEQVVIELWREDQFFYSTLFPKLELQMGDVDRKLKREDWSCVVDLRDIKRTLRVATTAGKHLTDAWGILFGASPPALPELGYLMVRANQPKKWDILVDEKLTDSKKLVNYIEMNYPEAIVCRCPVAEARCMTMMDRLAASKLFIGQRSAATYLASMLKIGLVEYYPDDLPRTFLSQPPREEYRVVFGDCTAELIWPSLEIVWETSYDTKYRAEALMVPQVFTVETAVGK